MAEAELVGAPGHGTPLDRGTLGLHDERRTRPLAWKAELSVEERAHGV